MAGAHALEFAPEQGEPVLAKLVESPGLLGFGAQSRFASGAPVALRSPSGGVTGVPECAGMSPEE